eukprot:scaffold24278_cov178-Amphora_coffeaeformis.AAC.2
MTMTMTKLFSFAILSFLCATTTTTEAFHASSSSSSLTPKDRLAKLVVENLKTDTEKLSPALVEAKRDEFLTLCDDLYALQRGFCSDTVEGEWTSVLNLPGKKSRKQQSLVGRRVEKAGTTMANFVGRTGEIQVSALTPHENGKIEAVLRYQPTAENFNLHPDTAKIVLRRIACDNVKATLKYKKLPTLPIPFFRKKGGWLDFVYLDHDVRVTKGNRGGTFVHMRPEYLEQILQQY